MLLGDGGHQLQPPSVEDQGIPLCQTTHSKSVQPWWPYQQQGCHQRSFWVRWYMQSTSLSKNVCLTRHRCHKGGVLDEIDIIFFLRYVRSKHNSVHVCCLLWMFKVFNPHSSTSAFVTEWENVSCSLNWRFCVDMWITAFRVLISLVTSVSKNGKRETSVVSFCIALYKCCVYGLSVI